MITLINGIPHETSQETLDGIKRLKGAIHKMNPELQEKLVQWRMKIILRLEREAAELRANECKEKISTNVEVNIPEDEGVLL